ncbi:hypothetical protein [Actinosynnema sp. NPDC023587]
MLVEVEGGPEFRFRDDGHDRTPPTGVAQRFGWYGVGKLEATKLHEFAPV